MGRADGGRAPTASSRGAPLAKWAALSSQHVGGGGRGSAAAEASTPPP